MQNFIIHTNIFTARLSITALSYLSFPGNAGNIEKTLWQQLLSNTTSFLLPAVLKLIYIKFLRSKLLCGWKENKLVNKREVKLRVQPSLYPVSTACSLRKSIRTWQNILLVCSLCLQWFVPPWSIGNNKSAIITGSLGHEVCWGIALKGKDKILHCRSLLESHMKSCS